MNKLLKDTMLWPCIVLMLGCILALYERQVLRQVQLEERVQRFSQVSQRAVARLERRMQNFEYGLRGTRGAVIVAGEQLNSAKFAAYSASRDIEHEFVGARGFGFIRRVSQQQEASFLRRVRADGRPNFSIKQITPHSGDRLVIEYIEPVDRNSAAIGLDIASEPNRLQAARNAIHNNAATLTHPITLMQASGKVGRGFLFMLPVYRWGQIPQTAQQRWQASVGLSYVPLVIDEVLADFDFGGGEFSLAIDDVDSVNRSDRFYTSGDTHASASPNLVTQTKLALHGRDWLVEVKATPKFIDDLNQTNPDKVASITVMLSLLSAALLYFYLQHSLRRRQSLLDQARLGAIVASANDAIVGKTMTGVVTNWNKAAERIFGYPEEYAIGRSLSSLIVPQALQSEETHILACVGRGELVPHFETVRRCRDGRLIEVSVTVSPICSSDGKVVGAAKIVRDISEQKLTEKKILELNVNLEVQVEQRTLELREALSAAERATQAKSEFLSNMSHEIRTPMNVILGLCHLVRRQNLPPLTLDMVGKIDTAGKNLLGIINDILDFSKIEAHRLEIEKTPFLLEDVLDNLATIMATAVAEKPLEVLVSSAPVNAACLVGDPLRLGQVLTNLVSNAIKFTQSGEVSLMVSATAPAPGADDNVVKLCFKVKDTGIGIPADKLASIFYAFEQADNSTTRTFGGTGLGLTISRHLVELMGGTISVQSTPGQGSEFIVELPFEVSDAAHSAMPAMLHQRVLIADDNSTAREILARTTASLGWGADVVDSGAAAIELTTENLAQPYDIVLLDWRMPNVDGLSAAMQIRERVTSETPPIIIMATAFDRDQLNDHPCINAVDVVITKPVTSSCLYNAVMTVKHRRGELTRAPRQVVQDRRLVGVRILVVDDSDLNREVAEQILTEEGAEVKLAADGRVALAMLHADPTGFDVVLMDVQMPVMDGLEATRQIRLNPLIAQLPVIALTAGAFNTHRDVAMSAGMDAFIPKPFNVDAMVSCINKFCAVASSARQPQAVVAATVLGEQSNHPIFRDKARYQAYLQRFAGNYADAVLRLEQGTPQEVAALTHKLQGAAATLGLDELTQAVVAYQKALDNESANQCQAQLGLLDEALSATLAHIELSSIDKPPAAEVVALPKEALDREGVRLLLHTAQQRLVEANPDALAPVLNELEQLIGASALKTLRDANENFDFAKAAQALQNLITDFK